MTGEAIRGLLTPLIGKPGSISIVVSESETSPGQFL